MGVAIGIVGRRSRISLHAGNAQSADPSVRNLLHAGRKKAHAEGQSCRMGAKKAAPRGQFRRGAGSFVRGGNLLSHTRVQYHRRGRA